MKRHGNLWPRILSFENLLLAFRKARKGKRRRPDVARFDLNLERELLALQNELHDGEYRPGSYRIFTIYERKPRQIAAAPFRDRVVHHALLNLVEPLLDRRFIFDSYACRPAKGVHRAVDRYQGWARRYAYALKLDVARYFPSIDHEMLKQQLYRHLKDPDVLRLFDLIIGHSPPFPDEPTVYFPGDDLYVGIAHASVWRYRLHQGKGLICAACDPRRLVEQQNRLVAFLGAQQEQHRQPKQQPGFSGIARCQSALAAGIRLPMRQPECATGCP